MLAMLVECEQPSFLDSVAQHPASHSVARQIVARLALYIGEPCPQTPKNGAPSDARGGTPDRGVPRTLHWSALPSDFRCRGTQARLAQYIGDLRPQG